MEQAKRLWQVNGLAKQQVEQTGIASLVDYAHHAKHAYLTLIKNLLGFTSLNKVLPHTLIKKQPHLIKGCLDGRLDVVLSSLVMLLNVKD